MKYSLSISNFLEKVSSLSHSIVFLYFLALTTGESFLISPCYSWNSAFKWVYLSFSSLLFPFLFFTAICKASWAVMKKAECRRIDAFELWYWRCLLRVPWTARKSTQSILKEISPEYSPEGQILKLKDQYLGHLVQRTDSLEKTLKLGKKKGKRRKQRRGWDGWMASPIQWTWFWANSGR